MFVKGKLLGVKESDIEDEMFIPLSRPVKGDAEMGNDNLQMSISMSHIPKRSFLNGPLMKNSFLEDNFQSGGFNTSNNYESFILKRDPSNIPVSSNKTLNFTKMKNAEDSDSQEENSFQENSLNQSMSILNYSVNNESHYMSNNVYSEHKSVILK